MTDHPQTAFWNRVADKYAARPIKDVAAYDAMLADAASRLKPTDRVLEIGCGTGSIAIRLATGVTRWHATDASAEMIRIARAKPAPTNLTFAVAPADGEQGDGPYDAVCAFLVLHLVADLAATLAAIRRQIAPGGLLLSKTYCLADMNVILRRAVIPVVQALGWVPPIRALSAGQLRAAIGAAGFRIEADRVFGNRHAHYLVARRAD